eukprot:Clim_evm77s147 gene=Clim_evmTU77s147
MQDSTHARPVVTVPGFMCFGRFDGGSQYWGGLEDAITLHDKKYGSHRKTFHLVPGPISSAHDRAVEVFYMLKGGTVDYGEGHSKEHGHNRYGRTYEGVYPEWDADHPAHFIGHSFGGNLLRRLHDLLSSGDFFPGYETSANWMMSMTTVNSPLKGSHATYLLGQVEDDSGMTWPLSAGWTLSRLVHIISWVDFKPLTSIVDARFDHWEFTSLKNGLSENLKNGWDTLKSFFWTSRFFDSRDTANFDLATGSNLKYNRENPLVLHNDIFYFSFASYITQPHDWLGGRHLPSLRRLLDPFNVISSLIGTIRMSSTKPLAHVDPERHDAQWWANDGLVPVGSQVHPHDCDNHELYGDLDHELQCHHVEDIDLGKAHTEDATAGRFFDALPARVSPGIWYTVEKDNWGHLDVVLEPVFRSDVQIFYRSWVRRLQEIDEATLSRGAAMREKTCVTIAGQV